MSKNFLTIISCVLLFACNTKSSNKFTISGEIKNAPTVVIYLEQISYDRPPQVLDSVTLINGKFSLKGELAEENLLQLRFPGNEGAALYFVVNDGNAIKLKANWSNIREFSFSGSPASERLRIFVDSLSITQQKIMEMQSALQQNVTMPDSLKTAMQQNAEKIIQSFTAYIDKTVAEDKSPVVSLFAVNLNTGKTLEQNEAAYNQLAKRFPKHTGVQAVIKQFRESVAASNQQNQTNSRPAVGSIAPDFSLPDENGKSISLSSFRGKYVLVDFWASWCGPCRQENPNVVAAFNKFKNKNFTILGVSLDKTKEPWLEAIKDDGLTWTHISDLKFWESTVVAQYGIQGIPYNILVDPDGKIVAAELRGSNLENVLQQFVK